MRMMLPALATSSNMFFTRDSSSPRSFAPAIMRPTSSCRMRLPSRNGGRRLPSGSLPFTIALASPSAIAVCQAEPQQAVKKEAGRKQTVVARPRYLDPALPNLQHVNSVNGHLEHGTEAVASCKAWSASTSVRTTTKLSLKLLSKQVGSLLTCRAWPQNTSYGSMVPT
jgi:hypothetical protein